MNRTEAEQLVATIEREYPGQISARCEQNKWGKTGKKDWGYRVIATLRPGQRTATVWTLEQWQSLVDAWQWFLQPGEKGNIHDQTGAH
ncbi:MAG TPA: hypothetical protein VFA41_17120 [Ktedonobacteraceae bacterium]|nr:hypothetical protein [Ktedonobacteraceae bacterium]